jgi:RHS repeat-associated protein
MQTAFKYDCTSRFVDLANHFTGKERDTESGNDYFEARYYGSNMGRFVSPDDDDEALSEFGNPQNLNLYGYANGNPLTNTDPSGHDCVTQTRTSSTTESVTVTRGGSPGGCGSGTYVAGTVDVNSIKAGADGHSIDVGYTPYSDASGAGVVNVAASGAPTNDRVIPGDNGLGLIVGLRATGIVADLWNAAGLFTGSKAPASQPAGSAGMRVGGWYKRTFQTSGGPLEVVFEVVTEGNTAVVKADSMDIFPEGGNVTNQARFNLGTGQMKQVMRGVLQDLKGEGYGAVRVEPQYRVNGANAGGYTQVFTIKVR